MRRFLFILIVFLSQNAFSQNRGYASLRFKSQIQQDLYTQYNLSNSYKRFEGQITRIDSNSFKFNDRTLFVSGTSTQLLVMFELGLLYPEIFLEGLKEDDHLNQSNDLDSSIIVADFPVKKDIDSFFNDSLTICCLKETSSKITDSKTIKEFRFLLFFNSIANPTEYFIELLNDNPNKSLDMRSFLEGARLTRIDKGSVLI